MKDLYDIIQVLTIPNYDGLTGADKGMNDQELLKRAIKLLDINIGAKRNEIRSLEELRENLQKRITE